MGFLEKLMGLYGNKNRADNNFTPPNNYEAGIVPNFSEEFAQESATDLYENSFVSYSDQGVQLHEEMYTLRLNYKGTLAQNGAQQIFAIIGYGNNLKWEDMDEFPMHNMGGNVFELLFTVKRSGNINIAFRDVAGTRDDNGGMNYVYNDQSYKGSN